MLNKQFFYGGQAVIEGVMMRGRNSLAIAVRRPDGEIVVKEEKPSAWANSRIREIPFLRGIVVLVETLIIGIKALYYSASVAIEDEDIDEEVTSRMLFGSVAVGLIIAIALFVALPWFLVKYLIIPNSTPLIGNLADGFIRLALFGVYLKAISLMPDIRRVFAYHGAEHATINAYEAGESLEVENVRKYTTAHSRCGTSFLLFVLVIAIIAHAFLGDPPLWLGFIIRLGILPAIAAVSYELIKFFAAHTDNRIVRMILAPGMALQSMTTRVPDDQQIEVGIAALKCVLDTDAKLPLIIRHLFQVKFLLEETQRLHFGIRQIEERTIMTRKKINHFRFADNFPQFVATLSRHNSIKRSNIH